MHLLGEVRCVVSLPVVLECGLAHPPYCQARVIVLPPRHWGRDHAAPEQGLWPGQHTGHWRDHHIRHSPAVLRQHPGRDVTPHTRAHDHQATQVNKVKLFNLSKKRKKWINTYITSIDIHSLFAADQWPSYWLLIYPSLNQSPKSTLSQSLRHSQFPISGGNDSAWFNCPCKSK